VEKESEMARVEIKTPAPDFELDDFQGRPVRLADYRGKKHVVLVFNRGFT
jgi:peroxiredoxin